MWDTRSKKKKDVGGEEKAHQQCVIKEKNSQFYMGNI